MWLCTELCSVRTPRCKLAVTEGLELIGHYIHVFGIYGIDGASEAVRNIVQLVAQLEPSVESSTLFLRLIRDSIRLAHLPRGVCPHRTCQTYCVRDGDSCQSIRKAHQLSSG